MKILVLGGTGAMGTPLVQILSDKGIDIFVTSRKNRKSVGKIHYILGNAHDTEFIKTILQVHWDAIVDFMVYSTSSFKERVNILLAATSQYIFLSSARVYARAEEPLTENSPRLLDVSQDKKFLSTDDYSLTKARQEDILKNSKHTNWTIIRPYITYSKNRLQLGGLEKEVWLYRALNGKTIVFSNDVCQRTTTLTYGGNVANGITALIGNLNSLGKTFNISTSQNITWQQVLNIYTSVLEKTSGKPPKIKLLDLNSFLQYRINRYQLLYDRIWDRKLDNTPIGHFIDVEKFISPGNGLKKCLEEFLKNPHFKEIDFKIMGIMDQIAGEKIPFTQIPTIKKKLNYAVCRFFPKSLIQYGLKIAHTIYK